MKLLIIICMILSLLIIPLAPVYGAAGAVMGVTGAVAALMQAYGYVTSVTGNQYDAEDVSLGISDMMEAYAAHLGTTVAALFPAGSILYTAGSTVLTYGSDIVDSIKGMIQYFSSNGELDYTIDSQSIITFGPGIAYKLPYTFKTSTGDTATVYYTGSAPSESVYMCFVGSSYIEVVDFSNTGGTVRAHNPGYSDKYGVDFTRYYGGHAYKLWDVVMWDYQNPVDVYKYTSSTYPTDVLAKYYYGDDYVDSVSSIVITGSDALPDTTDDTSLMIPGIGTAGTLDAAGEQILDLVVEGALDIVTQLPEGDPISPDLFDVFPFCLPYDMYRLLHVFDAEPQAPVIHWPIQIDSMGIDEELVVDLSEWDSVASLLRHLETIVFLVGLALITRKWIGAE